MTAAPHRLTAALVIAVALLALSAQPVAALQTNTALGGIHTNDTDFENAVQRSNLTIVGSGAAAYLEFDAAETLADEDFSSFDSTTWTLHGSASHTGSDVRLVGTTSDAEGQLEYDDGSPSDDFNVTWDFASGDDGSGWHRMVFLADGEDPTPVGDADNIDNGFIIQNALADDTLRLSKRSGGSGTTLAEDTSFTQADGTYKVVVRPSENRIAVYVDGAKILENSSVTFDTGASRMSWSGSHFSNTGTKDVDNIVIEQAGGDRGQYISATHSVDNAEQGFANLTLDNASAVVTWQEHDGSSWSDVASDTFTTTGNHTIDISAASNSDLRVNVTVTKTGDAPTAEIHDEGVLYTNHEPQIDNSSGSPTGTLTTASPTLQIDVSDTEFPLAQGEQVDVEFFLDGSSVGTDTLTSNGTASVTASSVTGGDHTWHAVATDSSGLSNTSQTFSITAPGNVTIREEAEPHDIVDTATVTVVISGSGDTVDRQIVNDGNISLAGLPTDEEYVVLVNATGYYQRAILVQDIFEQSSVFVLNESEPSVENSFVIEDRSGTFPPSETKLLIQKPVNRSLYDSGASNEYQWLTLGGDRLGADQSLTVALRQDGRYRLVAQNQDGDERILGEYTAANEGTVPLRVGNVNVSPDDSSTYAWDANYTNVSGTKFIKFQLNDPTNGTTDLRLIIYEYGNESNEIENSTHAGPYGTFSFTKDLSAIGPDAEDTTWAAKFEATRGGETITGSKVVGQSTIGEGFPIAPMWLHVGSVGFLILLAGLVGGLVNPGAGAATISAAGGIFWHMGFLPAEIGGGAIALGLLLSAAWIVAIGGGGIR